MAQPDDSSRLDDDTLTRLHDLSQANAQTQPAEHEVAASTLESLVQHSGDHPHTPLHVNLPSDQVPSHPWVASIKHKLAPIAEKLAVREHCGNFVVPRGTNDKVWEPMPIYVRLGMHLLFSTGHKYADSARIESLLKEQSIKQGRIFDSEQGALEHILSFIKTYELEKTLDQLLKPDPKDYKTFNEFFSRRLKPDARPPASPDDDAVVCSAADCRLVVYEDLQSAQSIWIKGKKFSLASLFNDEQMASLDGFRDGAAIAVFRLAPADYHRWHSPVSGTIGPIKHVDGGYATVNPTAVNEDFNVFTENRRDVTLITMPPKDGAPERKVALVAVGAMLVGSITWTVKQGDAAVKGDEQGYFSYGGSTCIAVFERGSIKFDDDLLENSRNALETQVRVGMQIGRFV